MLRLPKPGEVKRWVQDLRRDVIRMMRLKFIAVAMSILIAVFLVMLGSINMIMKTVSQSQSMRLLQQIAESERYNTPYENDAMQPPPIPAADNDAENGVVLLSRGQGQDDWDGNRRPGMATTEGAREDDRRPPQWENPDYQHPTRDVPPPWAEETVPPPQTAPPVEIPDIEETAPPPPPPPEEKQTEPAAPAAPVQTARPETRPPETRTAATETSVPETETEPVFETDKPLRPPDFRDMRPDRWNVSVTIDHFAILADAQGNFIGLRNTEDYTEEEARDILSGILSENKTQGMYGWLQFYRTEKRYGTLLVLTDKTSDQALLNNLYRTTIIVGSLMLACLLGVLIVLSVWITKPVQTAFVRQKQFVSDAGHELKTPIAVLTANADILQDEIGENKWLGFMQEQIGRMGQLVGDLLRLARMDNAAQEYNFTHFDLSMAVAATTLPFESAAFEQHRNLEMDVQPDIHYHGSEQHIRQLCAIFIDNAIKYSNENGIIKVTLLKRGEHCVLEFYNTGCEISQEESEKIFERFYRGDKARNNQGKNGYGLGLAIAKSIMEVHRIRIQVTCVQGKWIRFLLTL